MVQSARKLNQTDEERRNRALNIMTAPGWQPNPGDNVTGTVVSLRGGESEYGKYPVLTIERDDTGEFVAVHAFHTVLFKELSKLKPTTGSRLSITYAGKKVTNKTKDLPDDKKQTVAVYAVIDPDAPAEESSYDWGDPIDNDPQF